jgi:hypothetical protein
MDEDYLLGWIFYRPTLYRFGTKSGVKQLLDAGDETFFL